MARPRTGDEKLSAGRILDAAQEIVDREGVSALSMRRLGKKLDVDPMAIYHHLPNKQAIIAGLVQRVFAEIVHATRTTEAIDWQDQARAWAMVYTNVARRHASLFVHLVANADAATESVMEANEGLYAALAVSGMTPRDVVRSADVIVDYVHGAILGQGVQPVPGGDWRKVFRDRLRSAPTNELQALQSVFESLGEADPPVDFEFGLEVIIAGLERVALRR